MKLNLTLPKVAEIMGAKIYNAQPDQKITSFVTDSRVVVAGDCFIALKGQNHDAHKFIGEVVQKGAAVIVANATELEQLSIPANVAVLAVEDTLKALQAAARYHRLNSTLKIAAVTGSNGKSTTKQMLKAICQTAGETVANMGNFNNQFGVPFSLLEIKPKHQFGVFELGASHPGDIAETACITLPDVAILTNISAAHLAFFKDLETVYKTKTEIVDCINSGGTLVYNADDDYLSRLKTSYKGKAITYGFKPGADLQVLDTAKFSFTYKGEAHVFEQTFARHDKLNAAAACAAAIAMGIYMDDIQRGLASFTPMPMRMERLNQNGVQFILDCYNANPASMQNALEILGKEPAAPRIAVLGDMKELGETSKNYHRLIARQLLDNQIDYAFFSGPEMKHSYDALKDDTQVKSFYSADYSGWITQLKDLLAKHPGTCLIKASRSMNYENILKELR